MTIGDAYFRFMESDVQHLQVLRPHEWPHPQLHRYLILSNEDQPDSMLFILAAQDVIVAETDKVLGRQALIL